MNLNSDGEQYGFGMQFQQHQSQFYQQMHDAGIPLNSPPPSNDIVGPRQYGTAAHDQIMHEIDSKLRQRPQPPPMPAGMQQLSNNSPQMQRRNTESSFQPTSTFGPGAAVHASYEQHETANRVRRWIESRTITNVQDCRPLLNMEIEQGFALKKTQITNDRSAPRF